MHLLAACGLLARLLPPATQQSFARAAARQVGPLGHLSSAVLVQVSPDQCSRYAAQQLLADQQDGVAGQLGELIGRVGAVQDLQQAMECLLYCLELDRGSVSSGELDLADCGAGAGSKVFSSGFGTSILAESLRQQVCTGHSAEQLLLVSVHGVPGGVILSDIK